MYHRGLFQYLVMSFGLCNATAIFQRMLDSTFAGLKWVVCLVYLDDVLVWSAEWEEHLRHCDLVLQRARERNLCLRLLRATLGSRSSPAWPHRER